MGKERIIVDKSDLVAIADSIRTITGSIETYYPSELASQVVLAQLSSLNVSYDDNGNVTLSIEQEELYVSRNEKFGY